MVTPQRMRSSGVACTLLLCLLCLHSTAFALDLDCDTYGWRAIYNFTYNSRIYETDIQFQPFDASYYRAISYNSLWSTILGLLCVLGGIGFCIGRFGFNSCGKRQITVPLYTSRQRMVPKVLLMAGVAIVCVADFIGFTENNAAAQTMNLLYNTMTKTYADLEFEAFKTDATLQQLASTADVQSYYPYPYTHSLVNDTHALREKMDSNLGSLRTLEDARQWVVYISLLLPTLPMVAGTIAAFSKTGEPALLMALLAFPLAGLGGLSVSGHYILTHFIDDFCFGVPAINHPDRFPTQTNDDMERMVLSMCPNMTNAGDSYLYTAKMLVSALAQVNESATEVLGKGIDTSFHFYDEASIATLDPYRGVHNATCFIIESYNEINSRLQLLQNDMKHATDMGWKMTRLIHHRDRAQKMNRVVLIIADIASCNPVTATVGDAIDLICGHGLDAFWALQLCEGFIFFTLVIMTWVGIVGYKRFRAMSLEALHDIQAQRGDLSRAFRNRFQSWGLKIDQFKKSRKDNKKNYDTLEEEEIDREANALVAAEELDSDGDESKRLLKEE